MELRHLRYFQAVASTLNFSRAAEGLRVAQPALSLQIRDLEDELGTRLFDRNRVRVQLTDAGRTLARHVDKILAQVDIAVESVRATGSGTGGHLILCSDWRLAIDLIPATVAEFRALHPGIDVVLTEILVHEQVSALRAGRVHLCFVPRDSIPTTGDFESMSVIKSEIRLIVSERHRFARRQSVRLADFRDETFIRPVGHRIDEYIAFVVQACRLAGFSPIFAQHKITSVGTLLALAGAGLGVAMLPDFACPADRPFLRYLRSDCPPVEIHAVWLRTESSLLLREYLTILRAHACQPGR